MRTLFFVTVLVIFKYGISQGNFFGELAVVAEELTMDHVVYDPSYFAIDYPNGDIPAHKGVCTDVVIRAYRKVGIDLQKEVHEDMKANFDLYPKIWGLAHTDRNIDHRRVPNMMTFFGRKGLILKITKDPEDYAPGDIVCWNLGGAITHLGIIANKLAKDTRHPLVVHNIGQGQVIEDMLFDYTIIGHYRYGN